MPIYGKLKLKIATVVTGHRTAGKNETTDRRGRAGGRAIFSELKIADFPGLCVASLRRDKADCPRFEWILSAKR